MRDERLEALERRTDALAARLDRLERRAALHGSAARVTAAAPAPAPGVGQLATTQTTQHDQPPRPLPPPAPRMKPARADLEDLLGGRVLAWVGGIAVLLGVAFLFAIAVSRGWIGEGARTLIAACGSLALLAVGIWLRERRARTEAALVAAGTAVAGLFMTVTVAAQVYELVPVPAGLALATVVGTTATALAVRWSAKAIGALGILGSLLAPVLVDAPASGSTLGFLLVALVAATGVLVWQRWSWLALGAFVVSAVQWVPWLFERASAAGALSVLVAFGLAAAMGGIGFELRVPTARLRASSSFLMALNAILLASAGWFAFDELGQTGLARGWLVGLALAHLGAGLGAARIDRISREIALLVIALGVVLSDVAFALIVDGPLLAVGWALGGAAFAALLRRARRSGDQSLLGLGLGGHLALALVQTLSAEAPPAFLGERPEDLAGALLALGAVAAGCFSSARFAREGHERWAACLDATGLALLAYLTAVALDGPGLVLTWALEAVVLGGVGRRSGDRLAEAGSAAFLTGAVMHALAFEAPPEALIEGLASVPAAGVALGAAGAAALACGRLHSGDAGARQAFAGLGALILLYLASTAVVTPFQPETSDLRAAVLDLGVRQQGQLLLSALWSGVGVIALVIGLRRDARPVRLASLGLLGATIAKVFLYDLSALTSIYRVVSFIGLGLLLLAAAYAWQRLRPARPPDLRPATGAA